MKATDLLEKQHRKVEGIFKKLEGGRSDPASLLTELANDLSAHMVIEQELFYPAVKEVKESYEEHAVAEYALKRLLATKPIDASFQARVVTLKELIEHHVEEEEQELFPKVEKELPPELLLSLGKEMKTLFDELVEIGALAIPGLGPFIAAGPLVAALSGAAAGAAVGGLTGALIGMGIPELEAKQYEGKIKDGNILLSVHVDDSEQKARARKILESSGATDIVTAGEQSVPSKQSTTASSSMR